MKSQLKVIHVCLSCYEFEKRVNDMIKEGWIVLSASFDGNTYSALMYLR